jgi:RND family efflux transporter MFP subunit
MSIEFFKYYSRPKDNFKHLIILITFTAFSLAGCNKVESSVSAEVNRRGTPIKVSTVTVQALKVTQPVTLSGFTEPVRRATPAARIMAKVIEASFHEGGRVKADKILIRLDTRDLMANKQQARAAFNTASTSLDIAQRNLKRMTALYTAQTVSRHQMESAQVSEAQATAARQAAKSAIEQIDVNLSYSIVCTPFKGIIVRKMVETGNMVAPGQPLFIIEDDSRLRIIAPLGTSLAEGLNPGNTLTVRMGRESVQGVIEGIIPSGSTEAPGLRVQLLIDNPQNRFKVGTLAVVEVPLAQTEAVQILVPRAALIEKGRLTGAYVITKGKTARLHWLILGENSGDMACVLSGLKKGDRIILHPERSEVSDGRSVEEGTL